MTVRIEPRTTETDAAVFEGRSFASGPRPYRVLLVGTPEVTADEALSTALATSLADRTRHGVDVAAVEAEAAQDLPHGGQLGVREGTTA